MMRICIVLVVQTAAPLQNQTSTQIRIQPVMRGKSCKKQGKDPTEAQIQQSIIEWCEWKAKQYPVLGLIYHIPNGGLRSKSEAALFKRLGVRAGMPDLCLPVRGSVYFALKYNTGIRPISLYLEIKTPSGKLSKIQSDKISQLISFHNWVCVVKSLDDAIEILEFYLGIRSVKIPYCAKT